MTEQTPPEILLWRAVHTTDDGSFAPDVNAWLLQGLRAYLSGEHSTMDRALGLSAVGAASARHRFRMALRDAHIERAAYLLDGDCRLLAAEVKHFERKWPRWRDLESPPTNARPIELELLAAFRLAGGSIPQSKKQLGRIVDKGSVFSCPNAAAKMIA